jgi:hypothetical protein
LLGDKPVIIEQFLWVRGGFMGSIVGSENIMDLYYGSNISVESMQMSNSEAISVPHSIGEIVS